MLIYSKVVGGVKKLFGTMENIPDENDNELIYKDSDGDVVAVVAKDVYVDNDSNGKVQRIKRISDGKELIVYIKDANNNLIKVLGDDPVEKVVNSIEVSGPTKTNYTSGEELDLTGLVVKEVYEDGDEVTISEGYTVSPVAGTAITETTICTVTHTASSKTATFEVTVTAE